jgi:RNA polymerase sigma-70 factor (ECF subfamily)
VEGRPLDEAELIARARDGDEEAYAVLVTRYSDLAFRTAYVVTGSATDAQEATQDGFLAAYRALPRFRSDAPLRPWLLRIVANAARNRRRASRRRADLELRLVDQFSKGDAAPSPEAEVEAAEERAALLRAVNSLDENDRRVIASPAAANPSTFSASSPDRTGLRGSQPLWTLPHRSAGVHDVGVLRSG